jgi:hypothetical protein
MEVFNNEVEVHRAFTAWMTDGATTPPFQLGTGCPAGRSLKWREPNPIHLRFIRLHERIDS